VKINVKSKKSGVTLIELMVTVSLASFLLILGYRGYGDMISTETLKTGTQQAAFAIKKARYYATSKGDITRINFPVGSNSYSITADGKVITDNGRFDAMSGVLPENVTISTNSCNNLGFYVDGTPIDTNNQPILTDCKIKLSYKGEEQLITIQAETGNIIDE